MKNRINNILTEQINNLINLKESNYSDKVIKMSNKIIDTIINGGKILIAGNGGSAADSQHFAAEIVGRFISERQGYPAIALTTDTSILTAIGNDYGYDDIFSRQIEALGKEGDIFIGLSTSGNSKNIIKAIEKSHEKGLLCFSLTGNDGGVIKKMSDENINFQYSQTARVQEHHLMTYHMICEIVEKKLKEYYEK